jgi:hypothetical protein
MDCTACVSWGILYQQRCLGECPLGTFLSSGSCSPCANNCKTCLSASQCYSCQPTYLLYGLTCVSACPGGFFKNWQD